MAGTTLATDGRRGRAPADAQRTALSVVTTALALATLGALVPAAVDAATSGGPPAVQPVSVRLDGTLSTRGLPQTPATSRLVLRNEGRGPVRWALDTSVAGSAAAAVTITVWAALDDDCRVEGVHLRPGTWSEDALPADGSLPLCVLVADDGSASGTARPRVSVHARTP
ncbi:MAG: hypothetical protein U0S36_00570 [Candidatus Nanopelagicales bacterium]